MKQRRRFSAEFKREAVRLMRAREANRQAFKALVMDRRRGFHATDSALFVLSRSLAGSLTLLCLISKRRLD
jgi:hypothetical protein